MATINDCKFNALRTLGFTGAINDMELAWLQSLGATSGQVNDAWLEVAGAGQFNDQVMAYMITEGAVGDQFNDVKLDFWCNVMGGGTTPPVPPVAFSDGFSNGFA